MTHPLATAPQRAAFRTVQADGVDVFYREAGPLDAPVILLLHGFPSSSHMYRDLIPLLATRYRVIAPDLPGFGFTVVPPQRQYVYRFDQLTQTMEAFVQALGLTRYALYVFDYGAPVGLRLAARHPEQVTALISQNGNAYLEGLSDAWASTRRYWAEPTAANRDAQRDMLTPETTRWQYTHGADASKVAPESYTLDAALMSRPENQEIQLDLCLDYASNLTLYPVFQQYFRDAQPPALVIWGRNDPFFLPQGAQAFQRDLPDAVVQLLDTGHFALETHVDEIAAAIHVLLARVN
ncbi:MAG: alpha/beta hydrolase [Pseudomonadota bacterium]